MLSILKWDEREPYEKLIMAGIGALLLITMCWFVLINPVLSGKTEAQAQSVKAQRNYDIVNRALPHLGQGNSAAGRDFSRSVLIAMARNKSIQLSRVQPDGEKLTVWIEEIPTDELYDFVNSLITQGGAEIVRANISVGDFGLLSAQITMK